MSRRSTPQKQTDDRAFPIRVKIEVPQNGLGKQVNQGLEWLQEHVGTRNFAWHATQSIATDACAVYFRDLDDAKRFLAHNQGLKLADGTVSVSYSRPSIDTQEQDLFGVCNLYSMMKGQAAIRALFDNIKDETGNLEPLPTIYPDAMAPVVANTGEGLVLRPMRWGMPSPVFALKGRNYDRGVTNVRNSQSPHWRRWLGVKNRCVVPLTKFSEPYNRSGQPSETIWFALGEDEPLAFFAGIWVPQWTSVRKVKDGGTTDDLFAFLTTDANAEVREVHPKAMPVILRTMDEVSTWLNADTSVALMLQKPLPNGELVRLA